MYVKVKVTADSKKEVIKQKRKDFYIICVKEKAERNMANHRICEIIASIFKVSAKKVKIISGHQNPSKIIAINLPENLA